MAKKELLSTVRDRYQHATRKEKGLILDEFTAVTSLHRKHAIRLLAQSNDGMEHRNSLAGQHIYDEAVREALMWFGRHRTGSAASA